MCWKALPDRPRTLFGTVWNYSPPRALLTSPTKYGLRDCPDSKTVNYPAEVRNNLIQVLQLNALVMKYVCVCVRVQLLSSGALSSRLPNHPLEMHVCLCDERDWSGAICRVVVYFPFSLSSSAFLCMFASSLSTAGPSSQDRSMPENHSCIYWNDNKTKRYIS